MTAMTQEKILDRLQDILAERIIIKPFDVINLDAQIMNICSSSLISS